MLATQNISQSQLFQRLVHKEVSPAVRQLAAEQLALAIALDGAALQFQFSADLNTVPQQLGLFANNIAQQLPLLQDINIEELLRQMTPAAMLEACWLQSTSNALLGHTEVASNLFKIYKAYSGLSPNSTSKLSSYRRLFAEYHIQCPQRITDLLGQDSFYPEAVYRTVNLQLCLSLFPQRYQGEIIGYTLAHVFIQPLLFQLLDKSTVRVIDFNHQPQLQELQSLAKKTAQEYLNAQISGLQSNPWQRLSKGVNLYLQTEPLLLRDLAAQRSQTAKQQLAHIIETMAPFAQAHHHQVMIGDKPLNEWFSQQAIDTDGLLAALQDSPYFNSEQAEQSTFFTKTNAFGGPMFGVLSQQQLDVFKDFLNEKPGVHACPAIQASAIHPTSIAQQAIRERPRIREKPASLSLRDMYQQLLNIEQHPTVLSVAQHAVKRVLKHSRIAASFSPKTSLRYCDYSPAQFANRIAAIHRAEAANYQPLRDAPKLEKQVYHWGIRQLTPTLLTDGYWLQNVGIHEAQPLADSVDPVVKGLYHIFADEIGNGNSGWNHPNVYRRLLDSEGIDIAEFSSTEFSRDPRFLEAAFDLPVYLLSISYFPLSYLPELIGLTLAIELSGLGATYKRLIEELEYWNIDATMVRLHLSIDNLASGHAAISCDLVNRYLQQVQFQQGDLAMQQHWRRIWTGYVSLNVASRRFKRSMLRCYFKSKLIGNFDP